MIINLSLLSGLCRLPLKHQHIIEVLINHNYNGTELHIFYHEYNTTYLRGA